MTETRVPIHDLPRYWRDKIRSYRRENARLHAELHRMADPYLEGLPPAWVKRVDKLRNDCARYRVERNEARAELEALRTERA